MLKSEVKRPWRKLQRLPTRVRGESKTNSKRKTRTFTEPNELEDEEWGNSKIEPTRTPKVTRSFPRVGFRQKMMFNSQERQVRALESDAERTYRRVQRWAARMKGQSEANQKLGNHNIRKRACNSENSLGCKPRWKYP